MVFPWRVSDSDLKEAALHKHCYMCMNVKRCAGGDDACAIIKCSERCGASYHECKESEHRLLCEKEWIPCLNVEYGCDIEIQRYQIASHLPVCPANIVACTQEWNRWPVFCQDKFKMIPFRRKNPLAKDNDLDLELALRDQRMANEFYMVPRKTKLALRNTLTRRYPAVPLPNTTPRKTNFQDKTFRTLRDIVKFEVADHEIVGPQYGVAKWFLKAQEIQQRRWKDDVDQAIQRTGQPVPKKYWEYDEFEKGNIHKHCSRCFSSKCERETDFNEFTCCSMTECQFNCGFKFHSCKKFEHSMICPNFEDEGEFDWILRDRRVKKKKLVKPKPVKPFPQLFEPPSVNPKSCMSGGKRSGVPPPPPPPPNNLSRTLGLDMRLDTVTKLQQKPKTMHTFLCAQTFRRDQWESHSKNIHSDIHGGLNNWMVARCPMAHYGCGFSINRFYPGDNPGNRVVYSKVTESFGIQPQPPPVNYLNHESPVFCEPSKKPAVNGVHQNGPANHKSAKGSSRTAGGSSKKQQVVEVDPDKCYLTELPIELLQMIVRMLDSWSLNQLSLVCNYLRQVVSTLLDTRGCVALQWERAGDGIYKKRGWQVAYKRWFFSNHFDNVAHWGVNTDGAISNHLKVCPYNDRCMPRSWDKSSPAVKQLLKAIKEKTNLKKQSDWFIQ